MCKSRDPFFYTGVIVRARCARYNETKIYFIVAFYGHGYIEHKKQGGVTRMAVD